MHTETRYDSTTTSKNNIFIPLQRQDNFSNSGPSLRDLVPDILFNFLPETRYGSTTLPNYNNFLLYIPSLKRSSSTYYIITYHNHNPYYLPPTFRARRKHYISHSQAETKFTWLYRGGKKIIVVHLFEIQFQLK